MCDATQMIDLMQRAEALSGEYENVVLGKFNDHVVRMSRMERVAPMSEGHGFSCQPCHIALTLMRAERQYPSRKAYLRG
jgi:hypothetical protein